MSEAHAPAHPAPTGPATAQVSPGDRTPPTAADECETLGLVAYGQLAAFTQLAGDSRHAEDFDTCLQLAHLASAALAGQGAVLDRVTALGGDAAAQLESFVGSFDNFVDRTAPSTWWEGLLKGYVGFGVAHDFLRVLAERLDGPSREAVDAALASFAPDALAAEQLAAAAAADEVLGSRLALWGRRLVGEALGFVNDLLSARPALGRVLVCEPVPTTADPAEAARPPMTTARLFSLLTAEHSRRMGRIGLTA
ncbi:hypothetical protein Sked_27740 [Sanguibacter keddieii DSM 10542]|uniref:Ferritin-like domain-containing protein n=1 Tax=Sanguibacter keddieii (strain ATCC 51767 / DSM 10542 / NCFB 3025 / ST-74) TaxID=446469 RepID=D1BAX5_SANKS|nr:ferritin-like fold-containing protein [Sanguibacter keddieii]ACZ22676.1 hypothetical protein Sked_27740 [Sanguibacter keddieii DSM 10542]